MNTAAAWCMAFDMSSITPGVKLAFPILLPVFIIHLCSDLRECKSQVTPLTSIKLLGEIPI